MCKSCCFKKVGQNHKRKGDGEESDCDEIGGVKAWARRGKERVGRCLGDGQGRRRIDRGEDVCEVRNRLLTALCCCSPDSLTLIFIRVCGS